MQKAPTVSGRFILRAQAYGFAILLGLMWLVEILRVPYYFFGESPEFIWSRALSRTVILGVIWLFVHLTTRRLLQRLHELESYLRLCSWCRRVEHEGQWLTMEEFFNSRFATETSHAICPDCAARQFHRTAGAAKPT
ncbi:MAG TPA: hypothetical protein VG936_03485 [Lacunisphaera sp.]|nr:hypothetical protein [Lacunisphaera sp.]